MSGPPVVVDTNVVVSGLITSDATAPTARILDAMLRGELRFLLSEELLSEYRSVLLRPKIVAAHGLSTREVDEILVRLAVNGAVRTTQPTADGSRDDDHLFALLATEPDALLVSGDDRALRRAASSGRTPRAFSTSLR